VKDRVAVHLVVGNAAKSDCLSASYSVQFALLRSLFTQARAQINSTSSTIQPLVDALNLRFPVVIEADSVDLINSALRLQKDFGFQLVILGAAEAHIIAGKLAASTPPTGVIYRSRPNVDTFERARNSDDAIFQLLNVGVVVGLTASADEYSRNLRWEAGFARELGLSNATAISLITSNVATLYGLSAGTGQVVAGQRASFVLFNGDPLSTLTHVQLVATGVNVECLPKQE